MTGRTTALAVALGTVVTGGAAAQIKLRNNEVVLATPEAVGNVLKTLQVAYDPVRGQVYVVGAETGHVGVVTGQEDPAITGSWAIASDEYEIRNMILDAPDGLLWSVSSNAGKSDAPYIRLSDTATRTVMTTLGIRPAITGSQLPEACLGEPNIEYPIQGVAVDRTGDNVWILGQTAGPAPACDQRGGRMLYRFKAVRGPVSLLVHTGTWEVARHTSRKSETVLDMAWDPTFGANGAIVLLVNDLNTKTRTLKYGEPGDQQRLPFRTFDLRANSPESTGAGKLALDDDGNVYLVGIDGTGHGILARYDRSRGKLAFNWRATTDDPYDRLPEGFVVSSATRHLGLLHRRDEAGLRAEPYRSWLEVRRGSDGSLLKEWDTGLEATSIDVVESGTFAGGARPIEFVVGAGGLGRVFYLPANLDAETVSAPVGTSAEVVRLAQVDRDKIYALSRLGGSNLVVHERGGGGGHFYGPRTVGLWPVGMAENPAHDELYVLSHMERKVRILQSSAVAANEESPGRGELDLPELTGLDYQISDTLSSLAATSDGSRLLVMFAELGEAHIVDCSRAFGPGCITVCSKDLLPDRPPQLDRSPGTMLGDLKVSPDGSITAVLFFKDFDGDEQRIVRLIANPATGGCSQEEATTRIAPDEAGFTSKAAYYSTGDDRFYFWNLVLDASAQPLGLLHVMGGDGDEVVGRVIAHESRDVLWGTTYDQSVSPPVEILRKVRVDGDRYHKEWETILFPAYAMKAGDHMLRTEAGPWHAVFSESNLGNLYYHTDLP